MIIQIKFWDNNLIFPYGLANDCPISDQKNERNKQEKKIKEKNQCQWETLSGFTLSLKHKVLTFDPQSPCNFCTILKIYFIQKVICMKCMFAIYF